MKNKHEAMYQYIVDYPEMEKLFFNINVEEKGNIGIEPVFSESVVRQYIDGSAIRHYDFAIVYITDVSEMPNTTKNTDYIYDVQKFMEWIDEKNKAKDFPDFGETCTVMSILNLQNMPNVAGMDEGHTKFMFQCRVEYFEKKE